MYLSTFKIILVDMHLVFYIELSFYEMLMKSNYRLQ